MLTALVTVACLLHRGLAQSTGVPSITLVTSTPTPTAPVSNVLPSQAPLPPKQDWCLSSVFCAGAVSLMISSTFM